MKEIPKYSKQVKNASTEKQLIQVKNAPTEKQLIQVKNAPTEKQLIQVKNAPTEKQLIQVKNAPTEKQLIQVKNAPTERHLIQVKNAPTERQLIQVKNVPTERQLIQVKNAATERQFKQVKNPAPEKQLLHPKISLSEKPLIQFKISRPDPKGPHRSLLLLLLWKNFLIKIRHPIVLVFEIAIPCLFIFLLAYIRVKVDVKKVDNSTIYPRFPVILDRAFLQDSKLKHKIFYTPSNNQTDAIMKSFAEFLEKNMSYIVPFNTENEMVDMYVELNSPEILCGLVFKTVSDTILDVKLRLPFTPRQPSIRTFSNIDVITWQTNRLFPLFRFPGPRGANIPQGGPPYYIEGYFLLVAKTIIDSYISMHVPNAESILKKIGLYIQRMPYPPYEIDSYSFGLQFFFPIIIMLSFIYPTINQTKIIVLEKELRFTSMASMMGLSPSLQWFSHFLTAFLFNMISVVIMCIIMTVPLKNGNKILGHSDPSMIYAWLTLYLINCIMFSFMMSAFFSRANMAGVVCGAVYFVAFLPYYRINFSYDSMSLLQKLGLSLIFNTNMSLTAMLLSVLECKAIGMRWSYIFEPTSPDDDLTIFALFCTSLLSSFAYLLIALYISSVFPGEYGMPKAWYYFLTFSYWWENPQTKLRKTIAQKRTLTTTRTTTKSTGGETNITKISTTGNTTSSVYDLPAVSVDKLSKTYDNGATWAVKDFSMDMKQDEITILLGHNGAGKTTLMSMLCGLIPPTSGDVTIFDMNLRYNMNSIRKDLGICPQFDVLFDDLTVSEHLYFYCILKKLPKGRIQQEIDSMIAMLDLVPKTHEKSSTLSGGMKRKLSVGIALIGGSRFVLLDEATSGMDVSARRFIWDLLIKEKTNRAILLSTHFMEEADVLGDKIAIVEAGHMRCFGTPMELKKKYGFGYLLKIAVKESNKDIAAKIQNIVSQNISGMVPLTQVSNELTFSLPEKEKHNFTNLFTKLEHEGNNLHILNYGISITTIEEVFLRVGEFAKKGMNQFNEMAKLLNDPHSTNNEIVKQLKPNALKFNTGCLKLLQTFRAMTMKKLNFIFHNNFLLFAQFFLPPLVLLLSLLDNQTRSQLLSDSPELPLILKPYKELKFISFYENDPSAEKVQNLFKKIIDDSGLESANIETVQRANNLTLSKSLLEIAEEDGVKYDLLNLFGISVESIKSDNPADSRLSLTGLFSNQGYHTLPTIFLIIHNLALRTINEKYELKLSHHPFPRKESDALVMLTFDSAKNIQICNALTFSVSFLLGSFVILIVTEIVNNFRHIQQISSLNIWLYWATHFLLDYIFWLISCVILTGVMYFVQIEPFVESEEIYYVFISMAIFGLAALPFTYFFSFMVADPATGYVRISLLTLILGVVGFVAVLALKIPEFELTNIGKSLEEKLQNILPIFSLPAQIYSIALSKTASVLCNAPISLFGTNMTLANSCQNVEIVAAAYGYRRATICCEDQCEGVCMIQRDYFDWEKPGSLQFLRGYGIQALIYWTLIIFVELFGGWFLSIIFFWKRNNNSTQAKNTMDSDVQEEAARIMKLNANPLTAEDAMWVWQLKKDYGGFIAVDNISFGVKKAECFGILGVNGAGKTTTFKMITGAERITSGDIVINKMNVKNEMSNIFKIIGYCPQFNGLLDELTGRQTLRIISRIRGIYEEMIDKQIDVLAKLFFFQEHIDKPVGAYSGGTKRKLSMACSIVGNPMLVFLDEPSTGVDPVSRRCLWNGVQALRAAGSSIVLTSHSMEECEALCNRLIIMVNARIRCIGSPLHLKAKFGEGCIIQIKCHRRGGKLIVQKVTENLKAQYGAKCVLESNHNNLLTFKLQSGDFLLSKIFGHIEGLMMNKEYQIVDYSVNQTSLERIFLTFAREQIEVVRK